MVKVIGDGKEYEFKEVEVRGDEIEILSTPFDSEEKKYFYAKYKDKEPKQSFVSVPKEIQFIKWFHSDKFIQLMIGDHFLFMNKNWDKWAFGCGEPKDTILVDCILVPCTQEENVIGQWYAWEDKDQVRIEGEYTYGIYLGDFKFVHAWIDMNKKIHIDECIIGRVGKMFKVVPRSEL